VDNKWHFIVGSTDTSKGLNSIEMDSGVEAQASLVKKVVMELLKG
jgi:hypothetical protein